MEDQNEAASGSYNHRPEFLKHMNILRESKQFCDVVLVSGIDGVRFPVHKIALSASSPYFSAMFTGSMRESQQKEVTLQDMDSDILGKIIDYCYSGSIKLTDETVETMVDVAAFLQLNALETECWDLIIKQFGPSNCIGIALFAEQRNCSRVVELANSYMSTYFKNVCNGEEFQKLNSQQLKNLLSRDDIQVSSEEEVFQALISWVEHNPAERTEHLPELLPLIRMPFLPVSFIAAQVQPVCESVGCEKLAMEGLTWHLVPQKRSQYSADQMRPRIYNYKFIIIAKNEEHRSYRTLHIEHYWAKENKWTTIESMTMERKLFGAAMISENELVVVGGCGDRMSPLRTVECLNLNTMTWDPLNSINTGRYGVCVAMLNGFLYAVGGSDRNGFLDTVERYDPKSNTWHYIAPMSKARSYAGAAAINGRLYVIGGCDKRGCHQSIECYDPISNAWTICAPMSKRLNSPAVGVCNGLLYVVGGVEPLSAKMTNSVERYDPSADKWTMISSFNSPCIAIALSVLDNQIMSVATVSTTDGFRNNVEKYDLSVNGWLKIAPINCNRPVDCVVAIPNTLETVCLNRKIESKETISETQ